MLGTFGGKTFIEMRNYCTYDMGVGERVGVVFELLYAVDIGH